MPYRGPTGSGEEPEVAAATTVDSQNMTRTPHLSSARPLVARSALVAMALVAGACSLNGPEAAETTTIEVDNTAPSTTATETLTSEQEPESVTPVVADATPPTTAAPSTSVPSTVASTVVASSDPDVAGEPLDYGPRAGTQLIVVSVEHDDVLNFRVDPDPQSTIVATAAPIGSHDIVALGSSWAAPSGVWWLVEIDGQTAWANQAYLAGAGNTFDATSEALADLGSAGFETLVDAGETVSRQRVFDDGPEPQFAQVNEAVLHENGGMLIVDVLNLGDDSVKGERLFITVEPIFDEDSGDEGAQNVIGVRVISVEIMPLCGRGVSEGLCV